MKIFLNLLNWHQTHLALDYFHILRKNQNTNHLSFLYNFAIHKIRSRDSNSFVKKMDIALAAHIPVFAGLVAP